MSRQSKCNSVTSSPNLGSAYTDEEREFMMAVQRYKEVNQRPFPTWSEVLAVLVSLGYRKVAPPQPLPRYPAG